MDDVYINVQNIQSQSITGVKAAVFKDTLERP